MGSRTSSRGSSFGENTSSRPDAQAQAALLLLESLIHTLLDAATINKVQALEIFDSAIQVEEESAIEEKEPRRALRNALGLLNAMKMSFEAHSGQYDRTFEGGERSQG